jgi:hypothetical protein
VEVALKANADVPLTLAFGKADLRDPATVAFATHVAKQPNYTIALRLDSPPSDQIANMTKKGAVKATENYVAASMKMWPQIFQQPLQYVAMPAEATDAMTQAVLAKGLLPIVPTATIKNIATLSPESLKAFTNQVAIVLMRATSKSADFASNLANVAARFRAVDAVLQNAEQFYFGPKASSSAQSPQTPSNATPQILPNTQSPSKTPTPQTPPSNTQNPSTNQQTLSPLNPAKNPPPANSPQTSTTQTTVMAKKTDDTKKEKTTEEGNSAATKEEPAKPDDASSEKTDRQMHDKTEKTKAEKTDKTDKTEQDNADTKDQGGISVVTILIIVGVALVVIALLAFAYKKMKN